MFVIPCRALGRKGASVKEIIIFQAWNGSIGVCNGNRRCQNFFLKHSKFLVLKGCYYIHNFKRNLIFVRCLKI